MNESCKTCRFAGIYSDETDLDVSETELEVFCQRYPPVLVNEGSDSGQGVLVTAHPMTDLDSWCGEYQPHPDEAMRKAKDAGQSQP